MATIIIDGIYHLKEEIGKGGMAKVFLADVDHVAIVHPSPSVSPEPTWAMLP